jgi:hypothetical protein
MYLNLLANSMNSAMDKSVHPSFVELIKRMNTLDAKVFDKLANRKDYQKVVNPNVAIKDQGTIFVNAMPEWFIGWTIDGHDIFETSSSIVRLSKVGLIDLMLDRTAGKDGYNNLKTHPALTPIFEAYKKAEPGLELELTATESILYVNEYGRQFEKACK